MRMPDSMAIDINGNRGYNCIFFPFYNQLTRNESIKASRLSLRIKISAQHNQIQQVYQSGIACTPERDARA
jgi:hypothetical protein